MTPVAVMFNGIRQTYWPERHNPFWAGGFGSSRSRRLQAQLPLRCPGAGEEAVDI
jgi:hypothetical protein